MLLRPLSHLALWAIYASARESAWNGAYTANSNAVGPFRPYYVPQGTTSYDSTSPLIRYHKKWIKVRSNDFIGHSARATQQAGAYVTFTFYGTGIEWFGSMDPRHGFADVYIDGDLIERANAWRDTPRRMSQQLIFWKYDLHCGPHKIKVYNVGTHPGVTGLAIIDVDAFVVTRYGGCKLPQAYGHYFGSSSPSLKGRQANEPHWSLNQLGSTGVAAMQLVVISESHVLIIDKVEHNPLTIDGHPAWAALYNLKTHAVRPIHIRSNSFCAGGTFLGNGSLISVGGNPVVEDYTGAADFGDIDGMQSVRIFDPCDSPKAKNCRLYDDPKRIRLATPRWYNTVIRLDDGSALIIGGSKKGGWINNATVNNPTIEYFPPKDVRGSKGMPIRLPFLVDTLNSNLFPIAFLLPDGKVLIVANQDAVIYDRHDNTERRLPKIPNGVRVTYPMAGGGVLLPLSPETDYKAEILLCGGSTIDDERRGYDISSQEPATSQCSRLVLTEDGIRAGWQIEEMPQARTMPDLVLLPTGDIVIVNGAGSGISGYGNVKGQVGSSNADLPVTTPVLYRPQAPAGLRFTEANIPSSPIPRMYHSVATLTPSGDIMIAGSNPNLDRSEVKYGTEYRVEWLHPPYMMSKRPEITDKIKSIGYKQDLFIKVNLHEIVGEVRVVLMDLGFVTHAVHANSRMVYLEAVLQNDQVKVTGPPNSFIYPPGPGFLYIVVDSVPSFGKKVMVGDGGDPPVDPKVTEYMMHHTKASSG
ncbi:putative copper radical oxidase [Pluteus cervinus]|uniref:Copper radical oxidase n=1 Tax=Pluteus cervinus TaxID=181527 RepID=A0ACD3BDJ2_9AGAR|nr:putative copper radical oxidase [Pluteus cervinus]